MAHPVCLTVLNSSQPVRVALKPTVWLEAGEDSQEIVFSKLKDLEIYTGR